MSTDVPSLEQTLAKISTLANASLQETFSLPPEAYTSEPLHELERKKLFQKEWLCAGRTNSLKKAGDYFCFELDSQPVFVIRQKNNQFAAFANVCRHRMMTLLEGKGRCKRIVCPYHAWTYGADGNLVAAPHMDVRPNFDKSELSLHPIRMEIWHGWIYLTLSSEVESVASLLSDLAPLVDLYEMEHYVQIIEEDHVWNTNWKQLTENFMEGYHLPVAHKATVGGFFPVEATQFSESEPSPGFTYQFFEKTEDAPVGTAHADNTSLTGKQRVTSILPTIFPSHMYMLAPDHLWYLSLQPKGPDKVRIRYGAALAPEVLAASDDPEKLIAETTKFLATVNEEDRVVVEGIQRGANAPLSSGGPLCWLERENHEFTQFLARKLCD